MRATRGLGRVTLIVAPALALAVISLANASHQAPNTLETIAGAGSLLTDGSPAVDRSIPFAHELAVLPNGDILVSDAIQCAVRKISAGSITTIAGMLGDCGSSGDGGPATSARLSGRAALATDAAGNVYIGDTFNCAIRRVDAMTQIISHYAGGECGGPMVEGAPAETATIVNPTFMAMADDGDLYVSLPHACKVIKITGDSHLLQHVAGIGGSGACQHAGDGGPATAARLTLPQGIALDADENLYIADRCRLRLISAGIIDTIASCGGVGAGPESARLAAAVYDVAVDADGGVLVSEQDACLIRRIKDGVGTVVAGYLNPRYGTTWGECGYNGDHGYAEGTKLLNTVALATTPSGHAVFSELDTEHWLEVYRPRIRIIYDVASACIDTDGDGLTDCRELGYGSNPGLVDTDADNLADFDEVQHTSDFLDPDTDDDGCADGEEVAPNPQLGGDRDPVRNVDFFDVPAPAVTGGDDGGLVLSASATRNRAVTLQDVAVVLAYVGRTSSSVDYSADRNGDGVPDGQQLDRSPSVDPAKPWRSSWWNNAITLQDVGVALAQVGHSCLAAP